MCVTKRSSLETSHFNSIHIHRSLVSCRSSSPMRLENAKEEELGFGTHDPLSRSIDPHTSHTHARYGINQGIIKTFIQPIKARAVKDPPLLVYRFIRKSLSAELQQTEISRFSENLRDFCVGTRAERALIFQREREKKKSGRTERHTKHTYLSEDLVLKETER